ncbi:MAG: hypothetical protein WAM71_17595 [Candidatus Korobacteraceae bacterium]
MSVHEPVLIKVSISNNTEQTVKIDLGPDRVGSFRFICERPDGTRVTLKRQQREGIYRLGILSIPAGQTYTEDIVLSEWMDFDVPGEYKITAELQSSVSGGDGKSYGILSFQSKLFLHVAAVDKAHIEKICENLFQKILLARSYEDAAAAARALATIKEPEAVRYLVQATSLWHLQPITIPALAQTGGRNSIEALISLLRANDPDTRAIARSTLGRLESQTTDAADKRIIRDALGESSVHE